VTQRLYYWYLLIITSVGEELQNLSRFISINRLAIRKLCKKYAKWSGSTTLRARVEDEILAKEGTFSESMLKPALEQYTTFLHDVRAPFEEQASGLAAATSQPSQSKSSPTAQNASQSPLDFDCALEAPSSDANIVKYWIHGDNVTQLRILLLQHMRYANFEKGGRRRSSCTALELSKAVAADNEDSSGLIVLDNVERYDANSDDLQVGIDVARARWCNTNDAAVSLTQSKPTNSPPLVTKLYQTQLYDFLDTRNSSNLQPSSGAKEIRSWLEQHKDIKPVACIRSRRSRFTSLENNNNGSIWAALDEDVEMSSVCLKQLKLSDFYKKSSQGGSRFQHAVLVVHAEGDDRGLIGMLDKSHLVCGTSETISTSANQNLPD